MPHSRHRYARPLLEKTLSHSSIVGVIGQRQSGKTTLADTLAKEYESLDQWQSLDHAESNPKEFLKNRKHPFAIDECQLSPRLFPALKEDVRLRPRKGRFILTGSVRFTSRKAIRESLTGRIVNIELLPFSPAESHSEPLPAFLPRLLSEKTFPEPKTLGKAWLEKTSKRLSEFLQMGGLPGICFFRDAHVRTVRFEAQLETLLERDIRLLVNTLAPYRQLRLLLSEIASNQGQPLNLKALAKKIGVTAPTVKSLISSMEAMFLVRSIATEKQARPVLYMEDQGMATHLSGDKISREEDLHRGLFSCILPQFLYRPELAPIFFQYRTRGGAKVDIAVRTKLGILGVIPVWDEGPTASSVASARSFAANTANGKVLIAHGGSGIKRITENILSLPFSMLISDGWI